MQLNTINIIVGRSKTLINKTFINYKLNMKILRNTGRKSYGPALHYTHRKQLGLNKL